MVFLVFCFFSMAALPHIFFVSNPHNHQNDNHCPPTSLPPLSGALLTIGFTNSLVVLTMLTIPGVFIVFFVLPDVVGRAAPSHKVSWSPRELFCFSRGVTVTTTLLLLQNAAQFAWLQVPVEEVFFLCSFL